MKSRNLVLFGALAVIAIVAFVMYGKGYPPKTGVEGTIGAANRYQSSQIGDNDVTLKDPKVQAFLQSDVFHKIQTNPDFARAIASGDARKIFALTEFQKMAQDGAFQKVEGDANARRVLSLDALSVLAGDNKLATVAASAEARRVWALSEYATLAASDGYRRYIQAIDAYSAKAADASKGKASLDANSTRAMDANAARAMDANAVRAMDANAVREIDGLRNKLHLDAASIAVLDSKFYKANLNDFNTLAANADYRQMLIGRQLDALLTSADLAAFTTAGGFDLLTISNGDYRSVFQMKEWNKAAAMPDFMNAIADANVRRALSADGFTQIMSSGDASRSIFHLSE